MEENTLPSVEELIGEPTRQYRQLCDGFNAQIEALKNNTHLSADGREAQRQKIEAETAPKIEAIRVQAVGEMNSRADRARQKAEGLIKEQAEQERSILGDAVYADLIRLEVESLQNPDEILSAFESAPGEFERRIIGRLALARLRSEIKTGAAATGAATVAEEIHAALNPTENQIAALRASQFHFETAAARADFDFQIPLTGPTAKRLKSELAQGF